VQWPAPEVAHSGTTGRVRGQTGLCSSRFARRAAAEPFCGEEVGCESVLDTAACSCYQPTPYALKRGMPALACSLANLCVCVCVCVCVLCLCCVCVRVCALSVVIVSKVRCTHTAHTHTHTHFHCITRTKATQHLRRTGMQPNACLLPLLLCEFLKKKDRCLPHSLAQTLNTP